MVRVCVGLAVKTAVTVALPEPMVKVVVVTVVLESVAPVPSTVHPMNVKAGLTLVTLSVAVSPSK